MGKNELEKTFKESFKDLMIDNEFTVENIKRSADMLYSYILKSEELEKALEVFKKYLIIKDDSICLRFIVDRDGGSSGILPLIFETDDDKEILKYALKKYVWGIRKWVELFIKF